MNIFNKVALQGLKKNRVRTIVTIIGVILSAAMIAAVTTFGVSLLNYMINGAMHKYGDWQAGFLNADASFEQEQMQDKKVKDTVTFENIGYAVLEGGEDPNKPYLFIAGFQQETFDAMPITLLAGRLPENDQEVLVSGKTASSGGVSYAVGDTLDLQVGNRVNGKNGNDKLGQSDAYDSESETFEPQQQRTYTVVGICQTPSFEQDISPGYTMITRTEEPDFRDGVSLFVTLKNPRQVHSYVEDAADGHAYILNNYVLRFMGLSREPSDQIFNALLYIVGLIVILIIMIGSVFLIYNSFSISLNERTRQIGILSSVGATAKQLRNSVLFEGVCIGIAGIPIGIVAGIGSMAIVLSVVAKNFRNLLYSDVPLTLYVSPLAVCGAVAVSFATILISTYIPAKKAANTPVMECIRQTNEVKVESKDVKTSKLTQRICGMEGMLALKNFKRNKKRYRSIVLSLVLSVVLFIATSSFVIDLKQASEQTKVVTDYDIGFGTQAMDDSEMLKLYDELKSTEGVSHSSYQAFAEYSCAVLADQLSDDYWGSEDRTSPDKKVDLSVGIQFLDDSAFRKILKDLNLPEDEYTGQNGKMIAVAKLLNDSGQEVGKLLNLFKASSLKTTVAQKSESGTPVQGQSVDLTFVETVPPDTPPMLGASGNQRYIFQIMAPWSVKDTLAVNESFTNVKVKGMTFQSDDPLLTASKMKTVIEGAQITSAYILMNTSEVLDESRNYIFIANVFAYTFIIMISLIAVANVFNTISTNIKLRRQELAMLRSVGMSDRDFNKMMNFECIFYGMRALLFGLPLSVAASWLIYKGMFLGGAEGVQFVLPWASIGISVFGVLFIVFITMMYTIRKIKKENIIEALRDDMT